MRKILVSALILFVLIGLMLPASAGSYDDKKPYDKACYDCHKKQYDEHYGQSCYDCHKKPYEHKKPYDEYKKPCCEKPKIDTDINTAEVTQTQTAIPISVDNYNEAWYGNAGTQSIYQNQYSDVDQENK